MTRNLLPPEALRNPLYFTTPEVPRLRRLSRKLDTFFSPVGTVKALDQSKWQTGEIDYKRSVTEGQIVADVTKWTQGDTIADSMSLIHFAGSQDAGRKTQPYHFNDWSIDGEKQATWFLQNTQPIRDIQGATKYWWDLETLNGTSESQRIAGGAKFVSTIQQEVGPDQLGMYSSPYWWSLMFPSGMPDWAVDLWKGVAHWTSAALPTLPTGWTWEKTVWWQNGYWNAYPWCFEVPGYSPMIDTGFFFFPSQAEYDQWVLNETTPPPPPPPPSGNPTATATSNVNFRLYPVVISCTYIRTIQTKETLEIIGEDPDCCGYSWWKLKDSQGQEGYAIKPAFKVTP